MVAAAGPIDHVELRRVGERALERRYDERYFAWTPYIYRYLGSEASEALERTLIDAGAIRAVGVRR